MEGGGGGAAVQRPQSLDLKGARPSPRHGEASPPGTEEGEENSSQEDILVDSCADRRISENRWVIIDTFLFVVEGDHPPPLTKKRT